MDWFVIFLNALLFYCGYKFGRVYVLWVMVKGVNELEPELQKKFHEVVKALEHKGY